MVRFVSSIALICIFAMLIGSPTRAQEIEPVLTPEQEALSLAVAQVCANEAFGHPADCLLILQTVRSHGETPREQLTWVRAHSDCIFGEDEPVAREGHPLGNCPWTRHLTNGDAQPAGWPGGDWRWDPWVDSRGRSHEGSQGRWRRTRQLVRSIVVDWHTPRGGWPCTDDPHTWGGRLVDAARVSQYAHIYQPLYCRDPLTGDPTLNEGYRYRPRAFHPTPAQE